MLTLLFRSESRLTRFNIVDTEQVLLFSLITNDKLHCEVCTITMLRPIDVHHLVYGVSNRVFSEYCSCNANFYHTFSFSAFICHAGMYSQRHTKPT